MKFSATVVDRNFTISEDEMTDPKVCEPEINFTDSSVTHGKHGKQAAYKTIWPLVYKNTSN